jgi:hypothetical protein
MYPPVGRAENETRAVCDQENDMNTKNATIITNRRLFFLALTFSFIDGL